MTSGLLALGTTAADLVPQFQDIIAKATALYGTAGGRACCGDALVNLKANAQNIINHLNDGSMTNFDLYSKTATDFYGQIQQYEGQASEMDSGSAPAGGVMPVYKPSNAPQAFATFNPLSLDSWSSLVSPTQTAPAKPVPGYNAAPTQTTWYNPFTWTGADPATPTAPQTSGGASFFKPFSLFDSSTWFGGGSPVAPAQKTSSPFSTLYPSSPTSPRPTDAGAVPPTMTSSGTTKVEESVSYPHPSFADLEKLKKQDSDAAAGDWATIGAGVAAGLAPSLVNLFSPSKGKLTGKAAVDAKKAKLAAGRGAGGAPSPKGGMSTTTIVMIAGIAVLVLGVAGVGIFAATSKRKD